MYSTASQSSKLRLLVGSRPELSLDADLVGNSAVLLLAEAFHDDDVFGAAEAPVTLAVVDYSLRHNVANPGELLQFLGGGGVQINARLVRLRLRD